MRFYQHLITRCHSLFHIQSFYNKAYNLVLAVAWTLAWSQLEKGNVFSPAKTNPLWASVEGQKEQEGFALACLMVCGCAIQAVCVGCSPDKYAVKLFLKVYSFHCWKYCCLLFAVTTRRKMGGGCAWLKIGRGCDPALRQFSAVKKAVNWVILGKKN